MAAAGVEFVRRPAGQHHPDRLPAVPVSRVGLGDAVLDDAGRPHLPVARFDQLAHLDGSRRTARIHGHHQFHVPQGDGSGASLVLAPGPDRRRDVGHLARHHGQFAGAGRSIGLDQLLRHPQRAPAGHGPRGESRHRAPVRGQRGATRRLHANAGGILGGWSRERDATRPLVLHYEQGARSAVGASHRRSWSGARSAGVGRQGIPPDGWRHA